MYDTTEITDDKLNYLRNAYAEEMKARVLMLLFFINITLYSLALILAAVTRNLRTIVTYAIMLITITLISILIAMSIRHYIPQYAMTHIKAEHCASVLGVVQNIEPSANDDYHVVFVELPYKNTTKMQRVPLTNFMAEFIAIGMTVEILYINYKDYHDTQIYCAYIKTKTPTKRED